MPQVNIKFNAIEVNINDPASTSGAVAKLAYDCVVALLRLTTPPPPQQPTNQAGAATETHDEELKQDPKAPGEHATKKPEQKTGMMYQ